MDARKAFYLLLNKVRIQLQAEHAAKEIQLFLLACSAFTFCLFLLARFTVIIAVNTYVMTFAAIAAIVFFMKFRITRPGHKSAASLYDQYCGEDLRIVNRMDSGQNLQTRIFDVAMRTDSDTRLEARF